MNKEKIHPENKIPFATGNEKKAPYEVVFDPVSKSMIEAPGVNSDLRKTFTAHQPDLKGLRPPDTIIPMKQTDLNELVKKYQESMQYKQQHYSGKEKQRRGRKRGL